MVTPPTLQQSLQIDDDAVRQHIETLCVVSRAVGVFQVPLDKMSKFSRNKTMVIGIAMGAASLRCLRKRYLAKPMHEKPIPKTPEAPGRLVESRVIMETCSED
ncbi:hypothetical protein FHL15_005201 [Xylaria flabelliformis]|uniref:Uncharacterized protein n=1 Tax=Xylaria flabelliformis TaxID=2512241 RepID=A0A553I0T2_9PEZI|nr:hypothetical protein FHL15_005201 [Xylaria flabelliformis]